MARADSTIRVNIIGDAKSLQKAAGQAEASVGGLNKKLLAGGVAIAGAFAAETLIDFGNTAVKEADRVGDAVGRIEGQLGPDLAKALRDRADDFHALGASEGDMLELEARLIDIGKAAGIANPDLAKFAEEGAEVAAAMSLATDVDAATWIDKIGKAAASGDMRALRDLGIFLDDAAVAAQAMADTGKATVDALTEGELAAARQTIIIDTLRQRYGDVTTAGGDLEAKQRDIGAQIETLSGKIGDAIDGPLSDFLGIILALIDTTERSIQVLDAMGVGFDELLTPVARAADGLRVFLGVVDNAIAGMNELIGLISTGAGAGLTKGAGLFTGSGSGGGRRAGGQSTVNVHVQGGSPEAIERAVHNAVNTIVRRQGQLE